MNIAWEPLNRSIGEFLSGSMVQSWSTTLLHFVWQGFVITAFVSIVLSRIRPDHSAKRYAVTLAGMLCMVIFPTFTFWMVVAPVTPENSRTSNTENVALQDSTTQRQSGTTLIQPRSESSIDKSEISRLMIPTNDVSLHSHFSSPEWYRLRTFLFMVWLLVEVALASRLSIGTVLVWRIRIASERISGGVQKQANDLAQRMGLRRVPLMLVSQNIGDAMAYGFFRSVVILPAAWVTQMTPDMIQAVLAHELSHIRRHDVWVNLLQRIVETLFFYHPAVWWLSHQIRIEREFNCDAAAILLIGDAGVFAKTLEAAAQHRAGWQFAFVSNLGDDRMSLLNRINRVLYSQTSAHATPRVGGWPFGVLALAVPLLSICIATKSPSLADATPKPNPNGDVDAVADDTPPTPLAPERILPLALDPTESNMISLPEYVVEPPDFLTVEAIRLVPNGKFKLSPGDVLRIHVANALEAPIAGQYSIDADGTVDFGAPYGVIEIAGLSIEKSEKVVLEFISKTIREPQLDFRIATISVDGEVKGQFLIGPDGTINLGRYGSVYVAGQTKKRVRQSIENQLATFFKSAQVSVDVFAYNSKVYYIVNESADGKGVVERMPITGNDTVLDAIAQIGGLNRDSKRQIWISRPHFGRDRRLDVDWGAIVQGGSAETNYQLLPGDRLVVSVPPRDPETSQVNDTSVEPYSDVRDDSVDDSLRNQTSEENIAAKVERFNVLVQQHSYQQAIDYVRSISMTSDNRPIVESMLNHANLLAERLAEPRSEQQSRLGKIVGELRAKRMADIETEEALRKPIEVNFDNVSLRSAVEYVATQIDRDILLDAHSLRVKGIMETDTVSIQLKYPIAAKTALQLIVDSRGLELVVEDGIVYVTSVKQRELYGQTYDVGDLVGLSDKRWDQTGIGVDVSVDLDYLKQLITQTVGPDSWDDAGGPGNFSTFPGNTTLVVSNSKEIHHQIVVLLSQLRGLIKAKMK